MNKKWFVVMIVLIIIATVGILIQTFEDPVEANEPTIFPPSKPILNPNDIIYKMDEEMVELATYIRKRKNNISVKLSRIISYEVVTQSRENKIPVGLLLGIIETESMWNPKCKSKMNARGLMQILQEDGVEINSKNAYDISYNIEKGIDIFKSKLNKSGGNLSLALKYYVGGDNNYQKKVYKYMGKFLLWKINNEEGGRNV